MGTLQSYVLIQIWVEKNNTTLTLRYPPHPGSPCWQEFDTARSYVLNQARFTALGQPCEIRVSGDVTVVPAAAPGAPSTRFKATFREGGIIIGDGIARTT